MKESNLGRSIKYSAVWGIMAFFCGIIYIFVIGYIDLEIITPFILPEDPCYYHTHETPFWVEFLYMGFASNGHPDGSLKHLLLLVVVGIILGHITVKKMRLMRCK